MPGLLERVACEIVPVTRPGAPSDADGYDSSVSRWRPLARVGGFFTRRPAAQVFENSAVRSRRDPESGCFRHGALKKPVTLPWGSSPGWRETTLSTSSK